MIVVHGGIWMPRQSRTIGYYRLLIQKMENPRCNSDVQVEVDAGRVVLSELPPVEDLDHSTEIEGEGVGAVRHCVFSTGAFVEPITIWNEPRHLRFDVTAMPEPMRGRLK